MEEMSATDIARLIEWLRSHGHTDSEIRRLWSVWSTSPKSSQKKQKGRQIGRPFFLPSSV